MWRTDMHGLPRCYIRIEVIGQPGTTSVYSDSQPVLIPPTKLSTAVTLRHMRSYVDSVLRTGLEHITHYLVILLVQSCLEVQNVAS